MSTHTRSVDVRELLRAETGETRELSLPLDPKEIPDADLTAGTIQAKLTKLPEGILARFRGEATLGLVCDRCLEPFSFQTEVALSEEFAQAPKEEQWPISREGQIDLTEPLRQALILAQPTHPLCSGDCPGLCLICGQSLKDNHTHKET